MINHFLPYGPLLLPSFHVYPENYTSQRSCKSRYCRFSELRCRDKYQLRKPNKINSCYVKKSNQFSMTIWRLNTIQMCTRSGPWVYIGQCETIEWIILYYIRLRSGLMMSKGHIVTSRRRENKSDHNNVTCKEKKMKFNTKRQIATDEHRINRLRSMLRYFIKNAQKRPT